MLPYLLCGLYSDPSMSGWLSLRCVFITMRRLWFKRGLFTYLYLFIFPHTESQFITLEVHGLWRTLKMRCEAAGPRNKLEQPEVPPEAALDQVLLPPNSHKAMRPWWVLQQSQASMSARYSARQSFSPNNFIKQTPTFNYVTAFPLQNNLWYKIF